MLRGILGDDERYQDDVLVEVPGMYFAGDGARIDEDGDFWLLGRVDDVMNVSGHRHLDDRGRVGAGRPPGGRRGGRLQPASDEITGQAIVAFVTFKGGATTPRSSRSCAITWRRRSARSRSRRYIIFTPELPKTRSGKIMRRLLRDVAENRALGDTTTLADPAIVAGSSSARAATEEESKEQQIRS